MKYVARRQVNAAVMSPAPVVAERFGLTGTAGPADAGPKGTTRAVQAVRSICRNTRVTSLMWSSKVQDSFEDIIDGHARSFMLGRLDEILTRYAQPLLVFMEGTVVILPDHFALGSAVWCHRTEALKRGMRSMSGAVTRTSTEANGRFRASVRWTYTFGPKTAPSAAKAVYYCKQTGTGTVIEMIDYRQLAFVGATDWHRTDMQSCSMEMTH